MIPERFMTTGKRVDSGKITKGMYFCNPDLKRHFIILQSKGYLLTRTHEVDPETVEPVAVKVILESVDEDGDEYEFEHYRCPNCKIILHQHYKKSKEPMRYKQNYCHNCGQCLDWGNCDER